MIGENPGDLQPPPPLPTLPANADQADDIALGNNADLASIAAQTRAAGFDVAVARGERLPTISAMSTAAPLRPRWDRAITATAGSAGFRQHRPASASACR